MSQLRHLAMYDTPCCGKCKCSRGKGQLAIRRRAMLYAGISIHAVTSVVPIGLCPFGCVHAVAAGSCTYFNPCGCFSCAHLVVPMWLRSCCWWYFNPLGRGCCISIHLVAHHCIVVWYLQYSEQPSSPSTYILSYRILDLRSNWPCIYFEALVLSGLSDSHSNPAV